MTFAPSFYKEAWTKRNRNLPSSGLRVQIDPETMLWKDMLPIQSENYHIEPIKSLKKPDEMPKIRPIESSLECEITIESCDGVPLPK